MNITEPLHHDVPLQIPNRQEMNSCYDAFYEILTRVSHSDLVRRCQWVCKNWQKFIYETKFKLVHSQRTRTVTGYFIEISEKLFEYRYVFVTMVDHSPEFPSPTLGFLPTNTKIVAASSTDGLLCCVDNSNHRIPAYYICQPMTCQAIRIPNPRTRYVTEKMGMVVNKSNPTLDCKVLRLSIPKTGPGYHCEMFDSKVWAWKRLKDINLPFGVFLNLGGGIFVNGGFHWLKNDDQIFVFYVKAENWTSIELPQEQELLKMQKKLVNFESKIGVFFTSENWMKLWILENNRWKNKYDIDLRSFHRNTKHRYTWLLDMYSADMVLMRTNDEVIWYNCSNGTYTTANLPSKTTSIREVYSFQSDLVPCSLRS